MKVIILNSGVGNRMGNLTDDKPKCLVELINGETILGRQIKIFKENGLKDFLITTGPFEELLKSYVAKEFPEIKVDYVNKPLRTGTNNIYSLYLTKNVLYNFNEDVILLHGDMFFTNGSIEKLVKYAGRNAVIVDKTAPLPEKDFSCKVEEGIVTKIKIGIAGPECYFLAPIYKLSHNSLKVWLDEIERFVTAGNTKVYFEDAFNMVSKKIKLEPVDIIGDMCMEIDDIYDLNKAKKYLLT